MLLVHVMDVIGFNYISPADSSMPAISYITTSARHHLSIYDVLYIPNVYG